VAGFRDRTEALLERWPVNSQQALNKVILDREIPGCLAVLAHEHHRASPKKRPALGWAASLNVML